MDTNFDFTKVSQILISDPVDCPLKEGYAFVNVPHPLSVAILS